MRDAMLQVKYSAGDIDYSGSSSIPVRHAVDILKLVNEGQYDRAAAG